MAQSTENKQAAAAVEKAAPVAEKTPSTDRTVELNDERGHPIGVTVSLGAPDEEKEGTDRLSSAIKGWSKLVVDGETYTFSRARASLLLSRFPHFRDQIDAALEEKSK